MSEQLIFQLIPKVMAEVSSIEKNRRNQDQKYSFRGVDDVYAAFHGPLSKHGIFYVPEVIEREASERPTRNGGLLNYTRLLVAYTFYASDGSNVRAVVAGEGMDSSDKSTNKAMSAALKYALLQIFCVPTEDQEDADATTPEPIARPVRPVQAAKPAPTTVEAEPTEDPDATDSASAEEAEHDRLESELKEFFTKAGKSAQWADWAIEKDLYNKPLSWKRATLEKWRNDPKAKGASQ